VEHQRAGLILTITKCQFDRKCVGIREVKTIRRGKIY